MIVVVSSCALFTFGALGGILGGKNELLPLVNSLALNLRALIIILLAHPLLIVPF